MSELYIEDGYTQTRTLAAVSGLHPALVIVFRPALDKECAAMRIKLQSSDPAVVDNATTDLITRFTVSLNGDESVKDKSKAARLKPAIRRYLSDLILGYLPADEASDAKN